MEILSCSGWRWIGAHKGDRKDKGKGEHCDRKARVWHQEREGRGHHDREAAEARNIDTNAHAHTHTLTNTGLDCDRKRNTEVNLSKSQEVTSGT